MSRLIVKNLPKNIKQDKLQSLFASYGEVTDCTLKFTDDGVFRKFAFIGFKTAESANQAFKYFNHSYIGTSKIQISHASDIGDVNKPRSWSKYASDSSYQQQRHQQSQSASLEQKDNIISNQDRIKKPAGGKKDGVVNKLLGELAEDPSFHEFLSVHQTSSNKNVWDNEVTSKRASTKSNKQSKEHIEKPNFEGDDEDEEDKEDEDTDDKSVPVQQTSSKTWLKSKADLLELMEGKTQSSTIATKGVSDMEYLRSKMSSTEEAVSETQVTSLSKDRKKQRNDSDNAQHQSQHEILRQPQESKTDLKTPEFTIKMKGFQSMGTKKSIEEFFRPLKVVNIRIPMNPNNIPLGIAFVAFETAVDMESALRRNKNFIGTKRIYLKKCTESELMSLKPPPVKSQADKSNKLHREVDTAHYEDIAETGRLFLRNLSYSCKEEDLEQMFTKYGPMTEVNLPIDSVTKKVKGFAHITYMMPEHAVKAFTELDGSVFQGRMLHILPGQEKKEVLNIQSEGSSYKSQRAAKEKAMAGSSHNWNTLFLGVNAVADVMAERYGTTKSQLLDVETSQSLAVRLALGETQVVAETRDFLIENGVSLDSFSQAAAARSRSVILVKNLPAGTDPNDLQSVFSKHGTLGRVLMPPSGITAIIEFLEPSEARGAFTKLAYTKFQHVPLYLEWAPMTVFKESTPVAAKKDDSEDLTAEKVEQMDTETGDQDSVNKTKAPGDADSDDDDDQPETGSLLFVKNLNFNTKEEDLQKVFAKVSALHSVSISMKKDMKNPGKMLSMGYGFVQYKTSAGAQTALKELQHTLLDGHELELKLSTRDTVQSKMGGRKQQQAKKQRSTKMLIRNIPFEAKKHELYELFKVFGELKTVRLPKKIQGTGGTHRGFAFVDFLKKHDAKRAFNALCHSTHLYGRRLVLEWADTEENLEDLRKKTAQRYFDEGPDKRVKKSQLIDHLEAAT